MYDVIYEAEIALCFINKQPLQLNPQLIVTDFEKSLRKALRQAFPNSKHSSIS